MRKIILSSLLMLLSASGAWAQVTSCEAFCVTLSKEVSPLTKKYLLTDSRVVSGSSAAELVAQCQEGVKALTQKALLKTYSQFEVPWGRSGRSDVYVSSYIEATAENACTSSSATSLLSVK